MAVAYTDPARIAAQLGAVFTPEQEARALVVADGITAWIDQRTGRSWQADPGTIAGELHQLYTDSVTLASPPVSAIASIAVHPGSAVGAWQTLNPADYALFDPSRGIVFLPHGYAGQWVQVTYTSAAAGPPSDIEAAADVLAADLMLTTLNPESAGADTVSVGQNDISVKYAGASGQQSASIKQAIAAVDAHRRPVLA